LATRLGLDPRAAKDRAAKDEEASRVTPSRTPTRGGRVGDWGPWTDTIRRLLRIGGFLH
jgi:hypothetical protein